MWPCVHLSTAPSLQRRGLPSLQPSLRREPLVRRGRLQVYSGRVEYMHAYLNEVGFIKPEHVSLQVVAVLPYAYYGLGIWVPTT